MHAKDIMSTPAHTVRADAPVAEVVGLLEHYSITAVPVVDDGGTLVGMVSERDILQQAASLAAPGGPPRRVRDVMAGLPVTAWPEADVSDLAAFMVQRDAHTVPVVMQEHVVGVVSRCDVLRTLLPTDEQAQNEAQRRLDNYAGGRRRWPVVVHDGVATVDGLFDDDKELAVAEALVRTTAGIAAVRMQSRTG
ncbi:CBS domain-containing protein [Dactylosporangium sp. NPDC000244]|uniref:CBS domain-containing protein n=1 Tax=Dactylosporangium sp. NPDC000244 TaxID=3154365 RepID=UPI003318879E